MNHDNSSLAILREVLHHSRIYRKELTLVLLHYILRMCGISHSSIKSFSLCRAEFQHELVSSDTLEFAEKELLDILHHIALLYPKDVWYFPLFMSLFFKIVSYYTQTQIFSCKIKKDDFSQELTSIWVSTSI